MEFKSSKENLVYSNIIIIILYSIEYYPILKVNSNAFWYICQRKVLTTPEPVITQYL